MDIFLRTAPTATGSSPCPQPRLTRDRTHRLHPRGRKLLLVVKRGPGVLWEGFWEFPTIHLAGPDPARRAFGVSVTLDEGVRRITAVSTSVGPTATTLKFSVTKHRVTLAIHLARPLSGDPAPAPGHVEAKWASLNELAALTMGSATRRVVAWLEKSGGEGHRF